MQDNKLIPGVPHAPRAGGGAKFTWEGTCKGSLGLYSFYMKGLDSAGFSIAQPTIMRRASEAKWIPAAAANF